MNAKLTAALLATLFSGAALAAGGDSPTSGTSGSGTTGTSGSGAAGMSSASDFDSLDQDGDGYLTREDVNSKPALKEEWVNADRDGDGRLDRSEFSRFETMDAPTGTDTGTDTGSPGTMNRPDSGTGIGTGTDSGVSDPATPGSGSVR